MFSRTAKNSTKRSEDVKKSAAKVLDTKKDIPTRAKHLRLFLDNSDVSEIHQFFDSYYSHVYYIVYEYFIATEQNLRQKGAHKAQREELEIVLYLVEKILIYLPEALSQRWQYHSIGRLMSKLLHPGNSWKVLKKEAMRLFLLWYSSLQDQAGDEIHAIFATLVPGFTSPFPNMGITALATQSHEPGDDRVSAAPILPIIPPQTTERMKNNGNDITRIFNDVLLELMVSQVVLVEWREDKFINQKRAFNFLLQKYKSFYIPAIFPTFNWQMSLYKPSLELPEVRKFRPNFIDTGDGTKKMDPMLACRVVVIKWIAHYTHLTRGSVAEESHNTSAILNISGSSQAIHDKEVFGVGEDMGHKSSMEGQIVREVLYGTRANVNFVHEVYRQAFLLSFSHSPAMKKVITVYKDWIQMNVQEVPPFILEPSYSDRNDGDYYKDEIDSQYGRSRGESYMASIQKDQSNIRAGLQNLLQLFVTNAANVFLLEVSPEYPILLEEQVEMCKRVLNIYRYMVMNVKMDGRTWEQLLFILLQITQLTLTETPPRRREDTLGGRLAQAIFQTLIVTWIKANLYVVVSCELWDQFLEVLSSLTLWEELVREWFKTMETLTRVLARQVYNLDLNDLPLDRLSEQKAKRRRGKAGANQPKVLSHETPSQGAMGNQQDLQANAPTASTPIQYVGSEVRAIGGGQQHPAFREGGGGMGPGQSSPQPFPAVGRTRLISGSSDSPAALGGGPGVGGGGIMLMDHPGHHHHHDEDELSSSGGGMGDPHHAIQPHYNYYSSHRVKRRHGGGWSRRRHRRRYRSESSLNLTAGRISEDEELLAATAYRLRQRRSHSADSIRRVVDEDDHHLHDGTRYYVGSSDSRSISPSGLSSSMESHSIKDSPLQLMEHVDTVSEGAFSADLAGGGPDHPHHQQQGLYYYNMGGAVGLYGQSNNHQHNGVGGLLSSYPSSTGSTATAGGSSAAANQPPRSVMAGGTVKGWLPDVAVVLWRRMLGALGDVNRIADTVIHAQIYKYLIDLHDILVRIRANQGVSVDNLSTPAPPAYVPPFTIFAPWCFRALHLPDTYQRGRMYALRLLCLITVRQQDTPLPRTHLVQFYQVLHAGLAAATRDPDTVYNLVRFTGSRFFSLGLPGYSAFLADYLAAANSIISSPELKGLPRTEAVSIVGSLLAYPSVMASLSVLLPGSGCKAIAEELPSQVCMVPSTDLQDEVVSVLLKAGKKEPNGLARCIALSSLGIFVYRELAHQTFHPKLKDAIFVLLAALKFNNKAVAQVASDMLLLLSEQVDKIVSYHHELPKRIVEVLARSLSSLLPKPSAVAGQAMSPGAGRHSTTVGRSSTSSITKEDRRLLLSLIGCLGEWCMRLSLEALVSLQEDGKSLLHHVFEALLSGIRTYSNSSGMSSAAGSGSNLSSAGQASPSHNNMSVVSPAVAGTNQFSHQHHPNNNMDAFEASDVLPVDELNNSTNGGNFPHSATVSPLKSRSASRDGLLAGLDDVSLPLLGDESAEAVVQLAARTVLSHLVNHLNHFPGAHGAASLSSQVAENDDLSVLQHAQQEELSVDVLLSPQVQMFILNNTTLLSLVEIPRDAAQTLDQPSGELLSDQDDYDQDSDLLEESTRKVSSNSFGEERQLQRHPLQSGEAVPAVMPVQGESERQVRIILRDISGKFAWDTTVLHHVQQPSRPRLSRTQHLRHKTSSSSVGSSASHPSGVPTPGSLASAFHPSVSAIFGGMLTASGQTLTPQLAPAGGGAVDSASGGEVGREHADSPDPSQLAAGGVLSPPRHTKRHRPPNELPTHEGTAADLDQLDDLLQYLGHTSPELLPEPGQHLNTVAPWHGVGHSDDSQPAIESDLMSAVIGQRNVEQELRVVGANGYGQYSVLGLERYAHVHHYHQLQRTAAVAAKPPSKLTPHDHVKINNNHHMIRGGQDAKDGNDLLENSFQQARILFHQLGFTSWEKRPHVQLVRNNDQFVRELRNLDAQRCRETHKIAVIYVAEGQEDKISILGNTSGSEAFEEFVAGLGWEVELESHTGFIGGLPRNGTTGETAPYYATSFTEVMFHVSTRMTSTAASEEECMLQKTRHLGNDEVHIVWSEHWRDYRRGIIPTEFCDVLIVIYPLKNKLYRIQVIRKAEVPFFGPLYNEMIVDHGVLPGLVRATAVNASRAKRAMMTAYKTYYEERAKALDSIIDRFRLPTTFEEFVVNVFNPSQHGNIYYQSGASSLTGGNSSTTIRGSFPVGAPQHGVRTEISAALLDHPVASGGAVGGNSAGSSQQLPGDLLATRPRAQTEHSRAFLDTGTHDHRTGGSRLAEHTPLRHKLSTGHQPQVSPAGTPEGERGEDHWDSGHLPQPPPPPQHKKSVSKSPLSNLASVNRRPLSAVRQNSGGNSGQNTQPIPPTRRR